MADKGSVTGSIIRYIRKNIQNGNWILGEKIPSENELCRELGVSRVSVRSALQQFNALGILESVHGKGTFLISSDLSVFPSPEGKESQSQESLQMLIYILELRLLIEPEICGRAAEHASAELISELERLLGIMRSSIDKPGPFVEADMEFHLEICKAGGNPFIYSAMTDICRKRSDLSHMINLANGYYGGIYYHGLLLDAFRKHSGKLAKSYMEEHLRRGIEDLQIDNEVTATET